MKILLIGIAFSSFILGACESPAENDSAVVTDDIIESDETDTKNGNDILIISGINEHDDVYGDSQNYANIYGQVENSSQVAAVDMETGIVHGLAMVENNQFYLSFNMQGAGEREIILTSDESVSIPQVENIEDLENQINLNFIPNPTFAEEDSNSDDQNEIESEPEEAPPVASANFTIGETAYFDSGLEITVTSAGLTDERPYSDTIENHFVKVEFTIDNQTNETIDFNSHSVELYDSGRNKAEVNSKDWYSESIASGMKSNGVAYYETLEEGPFTIIIGAATWESE